MSLSVLVKSASGLPNVEKFSKSDPMCVITLEGRTILPESCVYGPYQHFVLILVVLHRLILLTCMYFAVWCCVSLLTICSLGRNPLPTSSLSLRFSFCCLQGRRRRLKLLTTILIQNGMRWGLQSPAAKLANAFVFDSPFIFCSSTIC